MTRDPVNLPASIAGRLRNIAYKKRTNSEIMLRRYAIERLLYRLSKSGHRDRFILKGAMLFAAWLDDPFRPIQDLDLLVVRVIENDDKRTTRLLSGATLFHWNCGPKALNSNGAAH